MFTQKACSLTEESDFGKFIDMLGVVVLAGKNGGNEKPHISEAVSIGF